MTTGDNTGIPGAPGTLGATGVPGTVGTTQAEPRVAVPEQRSRPAAVREEVVGAGYREGNRWDRIRWGPVWAGALVTLTTFVVLQLLFFALGWLDLGVSGSGSGTTASIVSGVLALVAFFLGALAAAACTMWRSAGDGVVHGLLMWALTVVGILVLAVAGGTALLGPLAGVVAQSPGVNPADVNIDPVQAMNTARETAGWTVLGLGLAATAAALGGLAGSKMWPDRSATTERR